MPNLFLAAIALLKMLTLGAEDLNYIVNGGFEDRLTGWSSEGNVHIVQEAPLEGKHSVQLGPGPAAIRQRYAISGLRIVEFGAKARSTDPSSKALIRVQCLDEHNHVLMNLEQAFDPKKLADNKGNGTGLYFKTHAFTRSLVVSIEKPSDSQGTVVADSAELHDYDKERKEHAPLCDLSQYMLPIWKGDTVFNETVLLVSKNGHPATGRLLYRPDRILSVKDSTLSHNFGAGTDYAIDGRTLTAVRGSGIPQVKDSEFPKGDYPWLSVAGRHLVVTYSHSDSWQGPTPTYIGDRMPGTMAKLAAKRPLTIVALGDSITLGINVSGYREEPPYMPTWVDLFAHQLSIESGDPNIRIYNTGLGGMTAQWGADNARDAVASLNPDLVLIAFGMNDFWSVEPEAFKNSIQSTIATVRRRCPKAEFILIASIRFDPVYTADPTYVGHLTSYAAALHSLASKGVQVLDMTDTSEYLYRLKDAKGLLSDPMHPDDFLARWYAQALVAMLHRSK